MIRERPVSTPAAPAVRFARAECVAAALIVLLLAALISFSIYGQSPPKPEAAEISAAAFSAARAWRHLSIIAAKPHPSGSEAHEQVREYLMSELRAAGLQPQIQHSILYSPRLGPKNGGVQNVLARLKGSGSGRALLLVAHYDSLEESFGASDDGSAVATLLETVRTLKAGEPMQNDVIVLFTDAEEEGMLGAQVFVAEHDWARDVRLVFNFEARGSSGPVIMFESSDNNRWLIGEFAKAAPFPFAHSLSYEIYKLLPNDTDLTVFKEAGLSGFNFAHIDGIAHYHSPLDTLSAVDAGSMQHQGSYAVALTRHFGNLDLNQTSDRNAVYFDLFGSVLVHYSSFWVIPLTVVTGALYVVLLILGFRRRKLTTRGILLGAASLIVSILTAALAGLLIWKLVWILRDGPPPEFLQSRLFLFGFVALALAIASVVHNRMRKRATVESLAAGALLWWLLLTLIISFSIPGGSFLFHWPLIAGMAGLAWMILAPETGKISSLVILGLCAMPALILWVPVTYQIFVGLTLNWIAFTMAMVVLLFGLLLPVCTSVTGSFKRTSVAGSSF